MELLIKNFGDRIRTVKNRLEKLTPDADGLKEFLLVHYNFESEQNNEQLLDLINDSDEDYFEWEEDEEEDETEAKKEEKRQQLRHKIDIETDALRDDPAKAKEIYNKIINHCDSDLDRLNQIEKLLADEFVKDHKREQVTKKVKELVSQGHKVLLISIFSDTVIDYYHYMAKEPAIAELGIGMAMGSRKLYDPTKSNRPIKFSQNNYRRKDRRQNGIKRQQIFRLFAPFATCRNPADRPQPEEEIAVLIGSETLSVGQNLQDADYLINIDLPWNPMILEQRIGRIDRPKQHRTEYIYVYYANSESQLLRQASRLSNLNKKLLGEDLANQNSIIPTVSDINNLGSSIYGDTLFDAEILPGYIEFINSLVKARSLEQSNLQEDIYQKQETSRDIYTQNEILHSEELRKLFEQLGEDYQPNPITIGHCTPETDEPNLLAALTLEYFGPNGEPIPDMETKIYWNDRTEEDDGYGMAISTAFKTPEAGEVLSAKNIIRIAQNLYERLVKVKQQRHSELEQTENLQNITSTSERINTIQKRIGKMTSFPVGIDRKTVKDILKKLHQWKERKEVKKLLKDYTDGNKSKLNNDDDFIEQLVNDTNKLSLLYYENIKPTSLKVSLSALLLRI